MIKNEVKIIKAECDSCHRSIIYDDGNIRHCNYGLISNQFGYGSKYDSILGKEYHVCEECWRRVLIVLDLFSP